MNEKNNLILLQKMKFLSAIIFSGLITLANCYNKKVEGFNFDIVKDEDFLKSYNTSIQSTSNKSIVYITLEPTTIFITVTKTVQFNYGSRTSIGSSHPQRGHKITTTKGRYLINDTIATTTESARKSTVSPSTLNTNTVSSSNINNVAKYSFLSTSTNGGIYFDTTDKPNILSSAIKPLHQASTEDISDNFGSSDLEGSTISSANKIEFGSVDQNQEWNTVQSSYAHDQYKDSLYIGNDVDNVGYQKDHNNSNSFDNYDTSNQFREYYNMTTSISYDHLPDSEFDFSNGANANKFATNFIWDIGIYIFPFSFLLFTLAL